MAPLPPPQSLTLKAIWEARESRHQSWDSIGIGMGALGSECDRQIWLDFRWASPPEKLTGQKLRLFETGNQQEDRLIADLRRVPGVEVWDKDEKNRQFKVYSHGGHVRGKMDAVAVGLPDAPKTVHVVECKSHNRKNFDQLVKQGVKKAKWAHYLQCQKYMQLEGLDRCLYMAVCKDDDDLYLERIEFDAVAMAEMDVRLEKIINYNRPPSRVAEKPDKYPCLFCRHKDVCHALEFGRNHCRTCVHSTPVIVEGSTEALWMCAKRNTNLTVDEQRAGCEFHLFLPDVVPGKQVDAGDDWIAYEMTNGTRWVDQEKKPATEPEAPQKPPAGEHDLYKTGDADAPEQIKDRNGTVVLQCCRRCGKAERELKPGEPCVTVRYWWHADSDSLWKTEDGSDPRLVGGDIVEELTLEEYEQACVWLSQKEQASQLGTEHRLNDDGICEGCLGDSKCLTTECPNHELTFDQMAGIQNKTLDYKDGQWFDPTAKAEAAE